MQKHCFDFNKCQLIVHFYLCKRIRQAASIALTSWCSTQCTRGVFANYFA